MHKHPTYLYFNGPIKLFLNLYLAKFLDNSAKLFFPFIYRKKGKRARKRRKIIYLIQMYARYMRYTQNRFNIPNKQIYNGKVRERERERERERAAKPYYIA